MGVGKMAYYVGYLFWVCDDRCYLLNYTFFKDNFQILSKILKTMCYDTYDAHEKD
jgi:hypothetical protein